MSKPRGDLLPNPRFVPGPEPTQETVQSADTQRDLLLDKTLRKYAQDLRIKTCSAWSRASGAVVEEVELAAAFERRLAAVIDELADLSAHPAPPQTPMTERDAARYLWLRRYHARELLQCAWQYPEGAKVGADCDKAIDAAMAGFAHCQVGIGPARGE
jgi:hypothetical protein